LHENTLRQRFRKRGRTHDQGSWTALLETEPYYCFCPEILCRTNEATQIKFISSCS